MKIVVLNGSPKKNGSTAIAIQEMVKIVDEEGIKTELIQVGSMMIRGCVSCNTCSKTGK